GLAEDHVVAGAASEHVIAVAAEQLIDPALTQQGIVAGLTKEHVVAGTACKDVVARAAEDVGGRQRPVGLVERDLVVAGLAEDLDERGSGDGRGTARDGNSAAVDEDVAGSVAANNDAIVKTVADNGQDARAGNERRGHRRKSALTES